MSRYQLWVRWGFSKIRQSYLIRDAVHEKIIDYINASVPSLLLIATGVVVYEFGFKTFWENHDSISFWLRLILFVVTLLTGLRLFLELFVVKNRLARVINVVAFVFALLITLYILPQKAALADTNSGQFLVLKLILYGGVLLGFIAEVSQFMQFLYSRTVNPGVLFVGSFVMLIVLGAFLLKVPNAVNAPISTLDAVFTSTSAVCVTGLIVVDTATHFTHFGQLTILVLIQIGGLGFMTLTGLLAYAVAGESSFKTQLAFRDIMSSSKINNIMKFVYEVVFVTLLIESIGAIIIYLLTDASRFSSTLDRLFFAIFHSVSAFCNAGFSTYTNGLYEAPIRFNYPVQFCIALLVILGGMGFPIVFNLRRYLAIKLKNIQRWITGSRKREYFPNIIMLNSRLALTVSFILLTVGFVAYVLFEPDYTLAQHPTLMGKLVTCFFGSVTPRTAGFNTVDLTLMSLPMTMVYLLLMWIGASPGSTGGGIKTTTAGVAFINMIAVLRGQDRSEFFRSEISHQSVRRAFAIILSSVLTIGIGIFFISVNDSDKGLVKIAFEVFSAFSTVGLSLGITAGLSTLSKIVLMIIMFIGRVGTITLLVIFIRQSKKLYYRYPKEDIAF